MARLSIDIPINLEKIEPKTGPPRRKSTGNSSIPITQPKSITPNYLRTSTASCHDFCKYGIKRAFPVKPWRPVGRKLDKNVNVSSSDERWDKDQRRKKVLTSPNLMPAVSSRQQLNELLKHKTVKTNAFSHQSDMKQPNQTFLKSSSNIRESRNDAGKDIKTSKTSKTNDFLPLNSSSLPLSSPKVPIAKIRTSKCLPRKNSQAEIKNCVEKNETEKKTSYENVPEKIIHVIEPKDENQNEGHAPFTTFSSNQNQKLNSIAENRKKTIRGARVIIPEEKDSSPKKLKFTRGKVLEIENGNAGSIDRSLRRLVSDGKFIYKKKDNNRGVLRHQTGKQKNRSSVLLNTVIEERASKLVEIRKSKVMALVGAFESVIKIQDSESSRTCSGF